MMWHVQLVGERTKKKGEGSEQGEEKQQRGVLRPAGQERREDNGSRRGSPSFHRMTGRAAVGTQAAHSQKLEHDCVLGLKAA